jgi:spore germination protein GerM
LRRILIGIVLLVIVVLAGWFLIRQQPGPVPPEEAGEVETVRDVTLYFGSNDAATLVPEYRQIASTSRLLENLRRVIEAVIHGPEEGGVATVPPSVRVRAVYVHDKTAFLDFSREIVDEFVGGSAAEYILVASIVQTVCGNFPEVEAVRILVEGEELDTLGGHFRISRSLLPGDWR